MRLKQGTLSQPVQLLSFTKVKARTEIDSTAIQAFSETKCSEKVTSEPLVSALFCEKRVELQMKAPETKTRPRA